MTLYARSFAVVVGIDKYPHLPDLHSAERDARAMARKLKDRGFSVHLLLGKQATRARLATLLGDYLPTHTRRDDRVLVYFAGHGVSEGHGSDAVGYLMPFAGSAQAPSATGLPMTEVVRWFGRYPAKHVMLLADACYGGLALSTRGAGLRPAMERYLEAITSRRMRVVLAGGGSDEQVNEWRGHGLFTHFVLRGLDGAADGNADGVITSDELVAYVKPAVARVAQRQWGVEQNPQSGRSGEGEFIFLTPRGASGDDITRSRRPQPHVSPEAVQPRTQPRRLHTEPSKLDAPVVTTATRPQSPEGLPPRAVAAGLPSAPPTANSGEFATSDSTPMSKRWVRVNPGVAHLGTATTSQLRDDDEAPRAVRLSHPFEMQRTELTQGQWRDVRGHNPSTFRGCGAHCPVEDITFWDALSFSNARSRAAKLPVCYQLSGCERAADGGLHCKRARFSGLTCKGYRLATEAEWEYVARAGTRTATYAGPLKITNRRNAPSLDGIAWHGGHNDASYPGAENCSGWRGRPDDEPGCGTRPVAQLRPNAWGVYDMIGNVWEWVWPDNADGKPREVASGLAVSRGGGWYNDARDCRAANRFVLPAHAHYFNVGLRLVRTL